MKSREKVSRREMALRQRRSRIRIRGVYIRELWPRSNFLPHKFVFEYQLHVWFVHNRTIRFTSIDKRIRKIGHY